MKKSFYYPIVVVLFICFSINLYSQENEKSFSSHEIGLVGKGIGNLSFVYKKQKNAEKYFRINASNVNFSINELAGRKAFANLNLNVMFGNENRKNLSEKIQLLTGWQWNPSFSYKSINPIYSVGFGIGYLVGGRYDINENFAVSIESIPMVRAGSIINPQAPLSTQVTTFNFQLNAGLNSNTNLVLVYKF